MAISYPRPQPTSIGFEQITIRAYNAVGKTESPFTYKQQIFQHTGTKWEADVVIPSVRRDVSDAWVSTLVSLRGMSGTILLGDPDHASIRGTATTMSITGSLGDDTVTADLNSSGATILAGDHFQLGSGSDSRLHMVLEDRTGDGSLEIWPPLRDNYTTASATLTNPKCVFRLSSNLTEWSINNASAYGISFSAVEDLT
jgi:hypothetical protein